MVKLSAELIEQAAQYTNPVRDRELDLRGYKIPVVENLGATLDQFDTVDFSDNEVRKLDGFPLLKRLKTLLMNNNRVCRIGENLEQCLPSLRELVLTNNNIQDLGDLDPLASVKTLTLLSLLRNPVTNKKHYRLYVINKIPQIRVLDFQKVKLKERQEAEKMFKGKRGAQLAKDISQRMKTFTPGVSAQPEKKSGPSQADVEAIKNAITNASSLAEVERLTGMLQAGQIPGRDAQQGQVKPEMFYFLCRSELMKLSRSLGHHLLAWPARLKRSVLHGGRVWILRAFLVVLKTRPSHLEQRKERQRTPL
uniref:Small nuclear ribonucleoprotein polypeptide A' n=1 Tax=Nothobranchius furzeri TaxID=105023 RepID=A0A8C6L7Z6_NOTFU